MAEKPAAAPVWSKGNSDPALEALNVAYTAGRDVRSLPPADEALLPHDLCNNAAHGIMLAEAGILGAAEIAAILKALLAVRDDAARGARVLDPKAEDIHMSIEQRVTAMAGAGAGGRLHTGRSRNDQVATDVRLWLRAETARFAASLCNLAAALAKHAREHVRTAVPGWTHMQPAMITTWGNWTAGYLASVARDIARMLQVLDECAECPLGAAASFGSSWPTNRERVAALLAFDRPTVHGADGIHSRGETEARFAAAAAQAMGHLAGIGQDLILFSTPPRQWVRLPNEFTTGSSIMPQKRNPDFAEVTRAKAQVVAGCLQSLLGIGAVAPGGYNRDTQWTKYLVMDVAAEIAEAPAVFAAVFEGMRVFPERMAESTNVGFLNATDVADLLARTRGLPFRDCYRVLGEAVVACEAKGRLDRETVNAKLAALGTGAAPLTAEEMRVLEDPVLLLEQRGQSGSPNPARTLETIAELEARVDRMRDDIGSRRARWDAGERALWKRAEEIARS